LHPFKYAFLNILSPGHGDLLQSIFELSVELPSHGFPPYFGTGLEHVRFLSLDVLPPPQVTGHFDHELQLPYEDQPPFTRKTYLKGCKILKNGNIMHTSYAITV
jgi:hypothetical protein